MVGFHRATWRSGQGMLSSGTNVLAMNVMREQRGERDARARPPGVLTRLPSSTPTQIMAKAKASIST